MTEASVNSAGNILGHRIGAMQIEVAPMHDWERFGKDGGEAIIYRLPNGKIAKIFRHWEDVSFQSNKDSKTTDSVQHKFWELQFKLPAMPAMPEGVVEPVEFIVTEKKSIVGYAMDLVENVESLDLLWRKDNIEEKMKILRAVYDLIVELHAREVIIGDFVPRDLAWQASEEKLILFDADGMGFPNFPCRTFSLGFADKKVLGFKKARNNILYPFLKNPYEKISDWIAFLAICMNVIIGLDPYDGVHPQYPQKEERVKRGLSVFHDDIIYPDTAPPLDTIPRALLEEIFFTFYGGKRRIPDKAILAV